MNPLLRDSLVSWCWCHASTSAGVRAGPWTLMFGLILKGILVALHPHCQAFPSKISSVDSIYEHPTQKGYKTSKITYILNKAKSNNRLSNENSGISCNSSEGKLTFSRDGRVTRPWTEQSTSEPCMLCSLTGFLSSQA